METTKEKEKEATHTPGPWVISCIDGVEDSLMVGGGDDGSDIVADIRTHENDILNAQAELYDDIPAMRSSAHAHGDCTESLDKHEKEVRERLAELESIEKEANANARLIASAPEMHELLREILHEYEAEAKAEGWDLPTSGEMIRELLAKIDGSEG
jgi:hypothetical protein